MKEIGKVLAIFLLIALLLSSMLLFLTPTEGQDLGIDRISPFASYRFVRSSQNINENEFLSLRDIYYYVSILNLTGQVVQGAKRDEFVRRVLSYQNSDGGFGDSYNDRSKAGSTLTAIRPSYSFLQLSLSTAGFS